MYARVTRWEGAAPEEVRASAQGINARQRPGRRRACRRRGCCLLIDPDGGRSLGISLFETEEDMVKAARR